MWGQAWATSIYLTCVKLIYWQHGYRWSLHDGTVPIPPLSHTWSTSDSQCSHLQLPLKLAWAVTIHKAQGKLCVELARRIFHRPHICCDPLYLANLCGEPFNNKREKSLYELKVNLASLSSVVFICLLNLSCSFLFLSLSSLVAILHYSCAARHFLRRTLIDYKRLLRNMFFRENHYITKLISISSLCRKVWLRKTNVASCVLVFHVHSAFFFTHNTLQVWGFLFSYHGFLCMRRSYNACMWPPSVGLSMFLT